MNTIRWGIMAPGRIARKFADAVSGLERLDVAAGKPPQATITAAGSREQSRARGFLDEVGYPEATAHGSYEALAADEAVDAVYVAAPHHVHHELALAAISYGKAVLCEKPLAVNTTQVREMARSAHEAGVFLMEAMWTRFLPVMQQVKKWITDGRIGAVRQIKADFCFRAPMEPEGRLFNPATAGGALLDVGVYTVSFASWITDRRPSGILGTAAIGATGVDEQNGMLLTYDDGAIAALTSATRTDSPAGAMVLGTDGRIEIAPPFWGGTRASLYRADTQTSIEFEEPHAINGFEYQIQEVSRCWAAGKTESRIMPIAESVTIMEVLDELRTQMGIRYPSE